MAHPQKHIDQFADEALERELVAQLSPDHETQLRNAQRAGDLRKRIDVLKQRVAKLTRDRRDAGPLSVVSRS